VRERVVAGLAVLALAGCGGEEKPPVQTVPTNTAYQHVASGAIFPTQVGPFARTNVYPGRTGSEGVIVGYAQITPTGPMLITVTLEASPPATQEAAAIDPSCREVYARRKDDIAKSNVAVKWLDERDTRVTLAGQSQPVQLVSFDYDFQSYPMRGYLFVACHVAGSWTLQYRVTTARDPGAGQVIARFIAALPPEPLHKAEAAAR
jgi:hypothetical protein